MKKYIVLFEVKKRCAYEGVHSVLVEAANIKAAKKFVVERVWEKYRCHAFHAEARLATDEADVAATDLLEDA